MHFSVSQIKLTMNVIAGMNTDNKMTARLLAIKDSQQVT